MSTTAQGVRQILVPPKLYPHPIECLADPLSHREQYLRRFSARFREEPDWTEKLNDRRFVAEKLRKAAEEDGLLRVRGEKRRVFTWSKDDVEFVYKELKEGYRPYVEECENGVQPSIDGVWRADEFIDEELRQKLIKAAKTLEDNPDKKWHPDSEGRLLDLVNPSYWPIVYHRTKTTDGEVVRLERPDKGYNQPYYRRLTQDSEIGYSNKFCLLPSEFEISGDSSTKIASYINNLALPEQERMFYPLLERIFSKFVPLFNHVLADLRREVHDLQRVKLRDYTDFLAKTERVIPEDKYKSTRKDLLAQFEEGKELTVDFTATAPRKPRIRPLQFSLEKEQHTNHQGMIPVAKRGKLEASWSPPSPEIRQQTRLEGKTVNVIVKMATIILTPDKPKWGAGHWHIEALKNERIIATGIHYYDQENITSSSLSFRRGIKSMSFYGNVDDGLVEGCNIEMKMGRSITQEIGSIPTKANRAIAFPNLYQHRIEPFELIDKTKNGYRRVLAFFLCDPSGLHKIPTTRTIPPQQPDVQSAIMEVICKTGARNLPPELFEMAIPSGGSVISREEAYKLKYELMKERTEFTKKSDTVNGGIPIMPRASH